MQSPLFAACKRGDLREARALLEADPTIVRDRDENGSTILHWAVPHKPELVAELLQYGADINATNIQRKTPLLLAMRDANLKLARELIEQRADINALDQDNYAAIHWAAGR
jgi:uncharacterized protein